MFTDAPVSFDVLRAHNADGEIAIERLILPSGRTLDRVHAKFSLRDGKLDAPAVQASAYGGTIAGSVAIDATRGKPPAIALRLKVAGSTSRRCSPRQASSREVRGGKTNVTVDVTMRGDSPHQWMSGISGRAQAVVGRATLVNTKLDPAVTFDRLAEAVNPFRKVNPSTELQCAVIRLPLAGRRGAGRPLDRLRDQRARRVHERDARFQKRDARPFDPAASPAGDPHRDSANCGAGAISGPVHRPTVTVDAVASATAIARIGAAIGTGGLSVLGETILCAGRRQRRHRRVRDRARQDGVGNARVQPRNLQSPVLQRTRSRASATP